MNIPRHSQPARADRRQAGSGLAGVRSAANGLNVIGRQPAKPHREMGIWEGLDWLAERSFARIEALEAEVRKLRAQMSGESEPKQTRAKREPKSRAAQSETLNLRLIGEVSTDRVKPLIEAVRANKHRPIKLTLSSDGGSVDAAHNLAEEILSHGRVHTHAIDGVHSAAVLIFAAGAKKTALRGAAFLLHRAQLERPLLSEREEGSLDNATHHMARFISNRTGTVGRRILRSMNKDDGRGVRVTLSDAVMMGLVDVVTRPAEKGRKRDAQ